MNAIAFARVCGLEYLHTPFSEIAHGDRPREKWAGAWETQFNFGAGEKPAADNTDSEVIDFSYNFTDLLRCFCVDDLTNALKATLPEFRRKYYLNKLPCLSEGVTVCIHIRRGDVKEAHDSIWTSTAVIARTVKKIKSILEDRIMNFTIRAFSQGKREDFLDLTSLGVELFLNADAVWTMQELIEADILITAKSSFSYVAALLSDGIIMIEPGAYTPLDNWLVCGPVGEFDEDLFERHLRILMKSKHSTLELSAR